MSGTSGGPRRASTATSLDTLESETMGVKVSSRQTVEVTRSLLRLRRGEGRPVLGIERTVATDRGGARGAVILVHGLAQNHRTWRTEQRSFVAMLAMRGYEVYNLDLRGHGWSRRLGAPAARSVKDYVEDVADLVAQLPAPAFVIGHSLGAAVGVLASFEVELRGLVHVGGLYTFGAHSRWIRAVSGATLALTKLIPSDMHVNVRGFGQLLGRRVGLVDRAWALLPHSGWSAGSMEYDQLTERLDEGFDRSSLAIWKEMSAWAHHGGIDPGGKAAEMDTPLLVVAGARDDLAHPQDGKALFDAAGSDDATYVKFTEANHGYAPGHLDIILGSRAVEVVWPVIVDWLDARALVEAPTHGEPIPRAG